MDPAYQSAFVFKDLLNDYLNDYKHVTEYFDQYRSHDNTRIKNEELKQLNNLVKYLVLNKAQQIIRGMIMPIILSNDIRSLTDSLTVNLYNSIERLPNILEKFPNMFETFLNGWSYGEVLFNIHEKTSLLYFVDTFLNDNLIYRPDKLISILKQTLCKRSFNTKIKSFKKGLKQVD